MNRIQFITEIQRLGGFRFVVGLHWGIQLKKRKTTVAKNAVFLKGFLIIIVIGTLVSCEQHGRNDFPQSQQCRNSLTLPG